MGELIDLLAGNDDAVELDRAALLLASVEYPGLDAAPFLEILDSYAFELAGRLPEDCGGAEYIAVTNQYLFGELGFRGNAEDYYNPRNSCLNDVLTARTGIPITLSIVYMEIARRLAKPIQGIGLPGHFLVRYRDPDYSAFIDPFHGGRVLSPEECFALAQQMTGADFSGDPAVLEPVGKRHMLVRMLNNLRAVYLTRSLDRKAIDVLTLLLAAAPDSAEEHKQRGILRLRLKEFAGALSDLDRYLKLAPLAPDYAEVKGHLDRMRHWIATQN